MSTQHTPGPWVINTAGSAKRREAFQITEIYVYAPDTQDDTAICADVIDPVTQEPSEANARLIAAAPDLLQELINIASAIPSTWEDPTEFKSWAQSRAQAAIAKATGEKND